MTTGRKSFSKGPSRVVMKELGGTGLRRSSALTNPRFGGNEPKGFTQTTPRKATGAGPGKKVHTKGQFKTPDVPGNRDFGLIGMGAPAPVVPRMMKRRSR